MGRARRAAKKHLPGTAAAHAGGNPSSAAAWPDVSSFGTAASPFGSPAFGLPKPIGGESVDGGAGDDAVPPKAHQASSAADIVRPTDTIAPAQNNYHEDSNNNTSTANQQPRPQRRNSIPMLQPQGQNLKPGLNSDSSIPVLMQEECAADGDDDGDGGYDDNEDDVHRNEEENQEQEWAVREQPFPSSSSGGGYGGGGTGGGSNRSFGPREAYYDDLNDADDYKEDEWAARRSRRGRRRSRGRDRDRHHHDRYSNDGAPNDDESYSGDGDHQEQNLMDLLNEGISERATRAHADAFGDSGNFHDSADLDASTPVGKLTSALPPPPPPSSSLQPQQKQPAAAARAAVADPVTDPVSAFGISSRWSQFEDDDQLQQMTIEANTAAVMMQMEKHMAKTEAEGGGHQSHDDQGQSKGWMEKARSVVAKIDGAKGREHLAATQAQNDKRGDYPRQTSLTLGDIQKAIPGEEIEVSISDGQGSSDRFNYSARRRISNNSSTERSIVTAMTKDTLDGVDLDAVCFAAAQTFGGVDSVDAPDENDVGPTPPHSSIGGSGSTHKNVYRYHDDEEEEESEIEEQKKEDAENSMDAGDDVDDKGSPKYRTAEGDMYYNVGDVPVGREVSMMNLYTCLSICDICVYVYVSNIFSSP